MALFEYAPAPESRDIARLKPSYQIFVDGQFRDGTGEAIKSINPADEEPLAEVAGDRWLTPDLFRFGASSLLNDLLQQRHKLATGSYDGPDYVTVD